MPLSYSRALLILSPLLPYLIIMNALQRIVRLDSKLNNPSGREFMVQIATRTMTTILRDQGSQNLWHDLERFRHYLELLVSTHTASHFRAVQQDVCPVLPSKVIIQVWIALICATLVWALVWEASSMRRGQPTRKQTTLFLCTMRTIYITTPLLVIFYTFHIDPRYNKTWPWSFNNPAGMRKGFGQELAQYIVANISNALELHNPKPAPGMTTQVVDAIGKSVYEWLPGYCGVITRQFENMAVLALLLYTVSGVVMEVSFRRGFRAEKGDKMEGRLDFKKSGKQACCVVSGHTVVTTGRQQERVPEAAQVVDQLVGTSSMVDNGELHIKGFWGVMDKSEIGKVGNDWETDDGHLTPEDLLTPDCSDEGQSD